MNAYAEAIKAGTAVKIVERTREGRDTCALFGHEGYVIVGETAPRPGVLSSTISVCTRCGGVEF